MPKNVNACIYIYHFESFWFSAGVEVVKASLDLTGKILMLIKEVLHNLDICRGHENQPFAK